MVSEPPRPSVVMLPSSSMPWKPAAMTICALLLARQFYDLRPSTRLKYATLGLLFVNPDRSYFANELVRLAKSTAQISRP